MIEHEEHEHETAFGMKKGPGNQQRRHTGRQGRQMTLLIGTFVKVSNSIERPLCTVCIVFLVFSLFYETQCTQYTVDAQYTIQIFS